MIRKITYLGLLLYAAGISACSREPSPEPDPVIGPKKVGLSVEGGLTRAVITASKDEILSLGIYGYSTGTSAFSPGDTEMLPNLFGNSRAWRTESGGVLSDWEYNPVALWPSDEEENNTFFAYSPHEDDIASGVVEASDKDTPGYPYLIYTVEEETNVSDQVDLLYSELNADVRDINYATNDGKVKYMMKHAMSWVRFLIYPVLEYDDNDVPEEDALYAITEFYFTGADVVTSAELNLCTGSWTPIVSGMVTYTFDHLEEAFQNIPAGGDPTYLGTTDNCMMLIPQEIVLDRNETAVNISYWYDKDGVPDEEGEWDWTEYYRTLPFPDVKLRAGSVVTFVVKLSVRGATIEFHSDNTIEEWLKENNKTRPVDVF